MCARYLPPEFLVRWLTHRSVVALDTETTVVDLRSTVPELVTVALSDGKETVVAVVRDEQSRHRLAEALSFWGLSRRGELVMHNASFDLSVLVEAGVLSRGVVAELAEEGRLHDTVILDQLIRLANGGEGSGTPGSAYYHKTYDGTLPRRGLAALAEELLGVELEKGDVRTSYGDVRAPADLTPEQIEYAGKDAEVTFRVYEELRAQLPEDCDAGWGPLSESIQIVGSLALDDIGRRGLEIDRERLGEFRRGFAAEQERAARVLEEAGIIVVPTKGKERGKRKLKEKLLRERLVDVAREHGIRTKKTKKGALSLKREDWEEHQDLDPLIRAFVSYKRQNKYISSFTDKWLEQDTDVIRPRYRTLVASGRTSCHGPNLQQIPKRKNSLREVFRASAGGVLYELDYCTLELCAVAQCCLDQFGESKLAELLNEGEDVHAYMASHLHGKPAEELTKDERFLAKCVNFGFWGGMGAKTFAAHMWRLGRLRIAEEEAAAIKDVWRAAFPEARQWLRSVPERDLVKLIDPKVKMARRQLDDYLAGRFLGNISAGAETHIWQRIDALNDEFRLDLPGAVQANKAIVAQEGTPELLDWLKWRTVKTRTGRRRAPVRYTEHLNTQFQGLAADGAKLALGEMWAQHIPARAFIHDAVLIEAVPGSGLEARCAQIMIDGMKKVIPDVRVRVEVEGPYVYWGEATEETRKETVG